jgi:hypothetical protein
VIASSTYSTYFQLNGKERDLNFKFNVHFPGKQASDGRTTVEIEEPGTPWPIRFHFVHWDDSETGASGLVNVGFEIGREFGVEPGVSRALLEEELEPIDPVTLQRIAGNYGAYLQVALSALTIKNEGMTGALRLLRGPGAKPARLTDDFYRLVASDYEARRAAGEPHLVKALSKAHHVTPGAASRWVKEARRRGYIDAKEGGLE